MNCVQTKDELLEQISIAVEQIQKHYILGHDIIKDCEETSFLCKCIDDILHHGLKEGLISWATEPSIWPLLEKITCTEDIEQIKNLHLKSDEEKCSVWIKMAVNLNLLGSYISALHQDKSLLSHYHDYAFLHDPVLTGTVESLLNYGIANFDFQITVDINRMAKLNNQAHKQEVRTEYDSYRQETKVNGNDITTTSSADNMESFTKKKRKKKKQPVNTVVISDLSNDSLDELMVELINGSSESLQSSEHMLLDNSDDRLSDSDTSSIIKADTHRVNTTLLNSEATVGNLGEINLRNEKEILKKSTKANEKKNTTSTHNNTTGILDEGIIRESTDIVGTSGDPDRQRGGTSEQQETTESLNEGVTREHVDVVGTSCYPDGERGGTSEQQETPQSPNEGITREHGDVVGMIVDPDGKMGTTKKQTTNDNNSEFPNERINREHVDIVGTSGDPDRQRGTCLNSREIEGYIQTRSLDTKETRTTLSNENNIGQSEPPEFSSSDFLLENSSYVNSSAGLISATSKQEFTEEIEDSASREGLGFNTATLKTQESTNLKKIEKTYSGDSTASETQDLTNLKKLEKTNSGGSEKSARTNSFRHCPPTGNDTSACRQSPLSYRVKKVENPEFVSSSYGSSYSDVTDMSYDDRDLNFIPGIHSRNRSSGFKSGSSSCDPKSSVSFDENGFPVFDSSHFTDSASRPSSIDESSGRFTEMSSEWDMFDDLLNMEEEHFSGPESFAGLTTSEELEIAIEHYKKMIRFPSKKTVDKDALVQKLIKLRLRLQQEKDGPAEVHPEIRKVVSHHFQKEDDNSGSKLFCDQCGKIIWVLWQPLFTCKDCGYHSHKKCLELIQRPCPIRNLSSLSYILDICPDSGLDAQQYRCAECRKAIAISKDGVSEARICDYTGQYFCDHCHWNDQVSIPARVIQNWDFTQYKVCRQTKQLLDIMRARPLLNLQQTNPMLFRYVEELREVEKLREDILVMKKYFLTCREALEGKLLIQLQKRQHFVDNAESYSFQDLLDLNTDVLLPEISKIHALFLAHIKADCQLCRARGFICEVCQDSSDVIFAFDPHAVKCEHCKAVFHKICFKQEDCPKCRRKKRVEEKT